MTELYVQKSVRVPDGVTVQVADDDTVTVKGPEGSVSRRLHHLDVDITVRDDRVWVGTDSTRKKLDALTGTFRSHIQNMVNGVQEPFEAKLRIVYAHFPIRAKAQGNEFLIENFLGERAARRARVRPGVTVEVKGEDVVVTGSDIEAVGQTAANIERATRIPKRDPRVFQDGIYITKKPGAE